MIIVVFVVLTLIFSLPRPFFCCWFFVIMHSKPRINLKVNIEASSFIDVSVCDRFEVYCMSFV